MKQETRRIIVLFVDDKTKEAYDKLKSGKFEDRELYDFINRAIDDLKKNPRIGIPHCQNTKSQKNTSKNTESITSTNMTCLTAGGLSTRSKGAKWKYSQ